jgi:hypothetical protein
MRDPAAAARAAGVEIGSTILATHQAPCGRTPSQLFGNLLDVVGTISCHADAAADVLASDNTKATVRITTNGWLVTLAATGRHEQNEPEG